jgi:hypothetical protein
MGIQILSFVQRGFVLLVISTSIISGCIMLWTWLPKPKNESTALFAQHAENVVTVSALICAATGVVLCGIHLLIGNTPPNDVKYATYTAIIVLMCDVLLLPAIQVSMPSSRSNNRTFAQLTIGTTIMSAAHRR